MEESRCVTLRGKLGLKDPVQNFEEAGAMEERIQKNRFPVTVTSTLTGTGRNQINH